MLSSMSNLPQMAAWTRGTRPLYYIFDSCANIECQQLMHINVDRLMYWPSITGTTHLVRQKLVDVISKPLSIFPRKRSIVRSRIVHEGLDKNQQMDWHYLGAGKKNASWEFFETRTVVQGRPLDMYRVHPFQQWVLITRGKCATLPYDVCSRK